MMFDRGKNIVSAQSRLIDVWIPPEAYERNQEGKPMKPIKPPPILLDWRYVKRKTSHLGSFLVETGVVAEFRKNHAVKIGLSC